MVTLSKITWRDFQKIIDILEEYGSQEEIVCILKKVEKQAYNIEVNDLKKEDLHKITVIVDMWNITKGNEQNYDEEYDKIGSKLQKAYFKNFQELVWVD
ncbi:hypothetical protein ACFL0E_00370 [Nanoarchaeota archaeon]